MEEKRVAPGRDFRSWIIICSATIEETLSNYNLFQAAATSSTIKYFIFSAPIVNPSRFAARCSFWRIWTKASLVWFKTLASPILLIFLTTGLAREICIGYSHGARKSTKPTSEKFVTAKKSQWRKAGTWQKACELITKAVFTSRLFCETYALHAKIVELLVKILLPGSSGALKLVVIDVAPWITCPKREQSRCQESASFLLLFNGKLHHFGTWSAMK